MNSFTICGTGHRPSPGRFDSDPATFARLTRLAFDWILDEQPDTVISGMALGWDQALATAALEHGIPVIAAIPFIGQADRWSKPDVERYWHLLERCSEKRVISTGGYSAEKFQRRNEAMVDDADLVLALWDGLPKGGTANCVAYAEAAGKPVVNLWSRFMP